MLVTLVISQWTARKYDKKVTTEVESLYKVKDAGRYNKKLVESDKLDAIQKIAGRIRIFHYDNTLPWDNEGARLLPTGNYMNYMKEITVLNNQFNDAVQNFYNDYDRILADASLRLKELYVPANYPSKEKVRQAFAIKIETRPVEDPDHFVLSIAEKENNLLRKELEERNSQKIKRAADSLMERFEESISLIVRRIEDNSVFRDSLINNLKSLMETAPKLNFFDDSRIGSIIDRCKNIVKYTPVSVRESVPIRQEIVKNATETLRFIGNIRDVLTKQNFSKI